MKLSIILGCFFLLLLGAVVDSRGKKEWRPVPVNSKRAIWAASIAATFLEVKYISLLQAWKNVEYQVNYEEYRVIFKARCRDGTLKQCQADVQLSGSGKVSNAYCWQASEEEVQAYKRL